ncbi:hypothetical protein LTR36_006638 [Oleoguttula mirabilis]|uniref:Uncharacterized protein n=1 Tax=Oleoguttula mirabilis TaxID=1507867 RepID=A0AAV9JBT0_9PEZI|nr:hypothetical protein LTR36_006638 [Oleoguttula mirabilis]
MAPKLEDVRALNDLVTTTLALLAQFHTYLTPTVDLPPTAPIENPPNPLHILRDAARLVKAHTTKISLLAINKPFTPSAIRKVLNELTATCLPAMMSAVHICEQEKTTWGVFMGSEVQARVRRVFKEMEMLLEEVRAIAAGNAGASRRDSLSSTGVVWESCDALIELEKLDIAGLAVQKAEQYRDTIKDAIEELREWMEGDDTDTEGFDALLDENDEAVEGDTDSIDDIFNAANSMPKDRPELQKLVEEAEGKLKKVVLLYSALIKRRLKTYKRSVEHENGEKANVVEKLDETMQCLRRIPHQVDELASCFYDLDEERAKAMLAKCTDEAKRAALVMEKSWETAADDEFTAWSRKWKEAVG